MREEPTLLGVQHKSVPSSLWGLSTDQARAREYTVDQFATPLLTLDRAALDHNMARMIQWADGAGVHLAPHGKTTMAPQLWRRFVDAGAWGITVATAWQAQVAVASGIGRILIANEVVDPVGTRALARATDDGAEIYCWVDSVDAVRAVAAEAGMRPIRVLVERGRPGGRTGARSLDEAMRVADAVRAEPRLRLCGVSGFEWTYGPDRSAGSRSAVVDFLRDMAALMARLDSDGAFSARPIVSAGGSVWFDEVARQFAQWEDRADIIVRSGCVQASDSGYFAEHSPFANGPDPLVAALTVRASVLSLPDPGVAILDAGKRDLSEDLGGPRVLDVAGAEIERMNDQHSWMRFPADQAVVVGQVVRLGVSHPCTTFDRWRLIPETRTSDDGTIVGYIRTLF
ncbi:amino acid deaminase [Microbacterium sp. RD1]|uniref:amino acid deaminase n=1 Tax=Microbacterium sp. RD1 TaxID=3457313 RepID=UPI003FA5DEF1